jgi:hypothetical protein
MVTALTGDKGGHKRHRPGQGKEEGIVDEMQRVEKPE